MNNIERIKERHRDKHPGIGSYLECMSRAYATGLSGFCLGMKKENTQKIKIKTSMNIF